MKPSLGKTLSNEGHSFRGCGKRSDTRSESRIHYKAIMDGLKAVRFKGFVLFSDLFAVP